MPSLFDRVPPLTFAPLAAPRHDQYWDLLVHLYDARFGPDATPAEGDGFSQRAITMEIEKFLAGITLASVDDALDTPLNIRANTDYRYLVDTGWLREDRIEYLQALAEHVPAQGKAQLLVSIAEMHEQEQRTDVAYELYMEALRADPTNVIALRAQRRRLMSERNLDELPQVLEAHADILQSSDEAPLYRLFAAAAHLYLRGDAVQAERMAVAAQ